MVITVLGSSKTSGPDCTSVLVLSYLLGNLFKMYQENFYSRLFKGLICGLPI